MGVLVNTKNASNDLVFKDACKFRANILRLAFTKFSEDLFKELSGKNINHNDNLTINRAILMTCVARSFKDMEASRITHDNYGALDKYRETAYMIKWIIKLRPITTTTTMSVFTTANETFAVEVLLVLLRLKREDVSQAFLESFTYGLRHFDFSEGLIMPICLLLSEHMALKKAINKALSESRE